MELLTLAKQHSHIPCAASTHRLTGCRSLSAQWQTPAHLEFLVCQFSPAAWPGEDSVDLEAMALLTGFWRNKY